MRRRANESLQARDVETENGGDEPVDDLHEGGGGVDRNEEQTGK